MHLGETLARYHFGDAHPFGRYRYPAFLREFERQGLSARVHVEPAAPAASAETLTLFHTADHVHRVQHQSVAGHGVLDQGDTPAFPGVYEAAATVVGTVIHALERLMRGQARRAFVPIAGLHHARRDEAAGFCVFNDCGIAIEALRRWHGVHTVAYIDIDAHHGDGVFYAFEDDPELIFADLHEDGRYLYPGTGHVGETGRGAATGTKLNLPLPPYAGDAEFLARWPAVEDLLERHEPEFIILQCGADSLEGDPLTHLRLSPRVHAYAAASLCRIADRFASGRLLALGGGGYNPDNIANGWCAVVRALVEATPDAHAAD